MKNFHSLFNGQLVRSIVGAVFSVFLAGSILQAAHAQTKQTITLGIIGNSVEYLPIFVAGEMGYFDKAGLKVDIVNTGSSATSAQMAIADAIDIGSSSWLDTIRAIDRKAPLVIVANSMARTTTMLLGRPGLKTVADLKGQRVSVGGPSDITMAWWQAIAKKNGLDGTKDVQVIYGGGTPARFAALASGAVQAAVIATPLAFKAIRDGYADFGALGPLLPQLPYMAWQANRSWAAKNKNTVTAFIHANNLAIKAIYDPANRDRIIDILARKVQVSTDDAKATYDLVQSSKAFEYNSDFTTGQVQNVIDQLKAWGQIPAGHRNTDAYVDHEFVDAAHLR